MLVFFNSLLASTEDTSGNSDAIMDMDLSNEVEFEEYYEPVTNPERYTTIYLLSSKSKTSTVGMELRGILYFHP